MNKKLAIVFSILLLSLIATAFQYVEVLKSEIVKAYSANKPANGHSWTEMECTSDLCIANNKVGIGTDSPSQKLEVNGSGLFTGDVCNGAGACLSDLDDFVSSQPIAGGTAHNRAMCTDAGGTLVDAGLANPICRFTGATCPTNWAWYLGWSTTGPMCCYRGYDGALACDPAIGHAWSNNATQETGNIPLTICGMDGCFNMGCSGTAPRVQVGCY